MATLLTLALVIWAFTYKPRKKLKPVKVRHALPVTAPPMLSPAEIARRDKERERAAKEAERERIKAEKEKAARDQAKIDLAYFSGALQRCADIKRSLLAERESIAGELKVLRSLPSLVDDPVKYHETYAKLDNKKIDRLNKRLLELENDIVRIDAKAYTAYKNVSKAKQILKIDTDSETE